MGKHKEIDLPAWDDLSEHDQAQVVAFIRTSGDEGIDYAWENYPPHFSDALDSAVARDITGAYSMAYLEMNYNAEWWRLLELGTSDT